MKGKTNMKKILITGKNSYIGTSFEKWVSKEPNQYQVDTIDMKDGSWKEHDFSLYDVVFHVAGIAHIKETKKNRDLYFKVNRDLAYETAKKAKEDGVKQFIFLSSMSVYGLDSGVITRETKPKPKSAYGQSKYEAEKLIEELGTDTFKIAILRPPMVYGKNCKGNYQLLSKFAKKSPIFPNIENKRSMLYIDNLSEFVRVLIDNELQGLLFPRNKTNISTVDMVMSISEICNRELKRTKIFNPLINLFMFTSIIQKVFGNLTYEIDNESFQIEEVDFEESIRHTEEQNER